MKYAWPAGAWLLVVAIASLACAQTPATQPGAPATAETVEAEAGIPELVRTHHMLSICHVDKERKEALIHDVEALTWKQRHLIDDAKKDASKADSLAAEAKKNLEGLDDLLGKYLKDSDSQVVADAWRLAFFEERIFSHDPGSDKADRFVELLDAPSYSQTQKATAIAVREKALERIAGINAKHWKAQLEAFGPAKWEPPPFVDPLLNSAPVIGAEAGEEFRTHLSPEQIQQWEKLLSRAKEPKRN